MKKIMIISALAIAAVLTACSNNNAPVQSGEPVNETVTGQTEDVLTTEVSDSSLSEKIKRINHQASVEQSVNPGMTMLKVELPINEEPDDKAEEFFEEVEEIVEDCKLYNNSNFDFFYFSTSKNGEVEITVSFKRVDGKFVLESVNGIAEQYKNAAAIAAEESELFRKAQ